MAKNKDSGKKEEMFDAEKEIGVIVLKPYALSAYNLEMTTVKKQPAVLVQPGFCVPNNQSVDLSGGSRTGTNGRKTWKLSEAMCLPQYESWYEIDAPVSFVATPNSDKPVYLTTTITFQAKPKDLVIEVYTWDKLGNPAPCIPFTYRCRVGYPIVLL